MSDHKPIVVVMGVTGAGKTTVGRALAARLGIPFFDADDFHPPANLKKMRAGDPLTDADRQPWLLALRSAIDDWLLAQKGGVLACSALKQQYRETLEGPRGDVTFFYLNGPTSLLRSRLEAREGHFMPSSLLQSQLETLEPPRNALFLDIQRSPEALVDLALGYLGELGFRVD